MPSFLSVPWLLPDPPQCPCLLRGKYRFPEGSASLCLIALLLSLAYVLYWQRRRHRRRDARTRHSGHGEHPPPKVRGGWPYFGHVFDIAGDLVGFLAKNRRQLGDVFVAKVTGDEYTFLLGNEATRFFGAAPRDLLLPVIPAGKTAEHLGVPDYFVREALDSVHVFHDSVMSLLGGDLSGRGGNIVQEAADIIDESLDKLSAKGSFNVFEILEDALFRACTAAFVSRDLCTQHYDQWLNLYQEADVTYGVASGRANPMDPRLWWRRGELFESLEVLFERVVESRKESGRSEKDLVGILMTQASHDGIVDTTKVAQYVLSRAYLVMASVFLDVYLAASWTVMHIAGDKILAKRVLAEVEAASRDTTGSFSLVALRSQMPLLRACIGESRRMHSANVHARRLAADAHHVTASGKRLVLKKDTVVAAIAHPSLSVDTTPQSGNSHGNQRTRARRQREHFDPDSVLDAIGHPHMHDGLFVCGGDPVLACPGKAASVDVAVLAVAMLVQRFDFVLAGVMPAARLNGFSLATTRPADGDCFVTYSSRGEDDASA
eukprot:Opistho-2@86725